MLNTPEAQADFKAFLLEWQGCFDIDNIIKMAAKFSLDAVQAVKIYKEVENADNRTT